MLDTTVFTPITHAPDAAELDAIIARFKRTFAGAPTRTIWYDGRFVEVYMQEFKLHGTVAHIEVDRISGTPTTQIVVDFKRRFGFVAWRNAVSLGSIPPERRMTLANQLNKEVRRRLRAQR